MDYLVEKLYNQFEFTVLYIIYCAFIHGSAVVYRVFTFILYLFTVASKSVIMTASQYIVGEVSVADVTDDLCRSLCKDPAAAGW